VVLSYVISHRDWLVVQTDRPLQAKPPFDHSATSEESAAPCCGTKSQNDSGLDIALHRRC
jgi:hypothetical protein